MRNIQSRSRVGSSRRSVTLIALSTVALLGLGACAQGPAESEDAVELRVAWWGSEGRHERTQEALEICEEAVGNITTSAEYASEGYDDRLATQFAAGSPPDIIQVVSGHISSYGQRGALLDIATVEEYIDTSAISPGVFNADAVDGTNYAVPITTNASGLAINITMMEKFGLELPDDENWSWDDLFEYATSVYEASGGEVWGLQQPSEDIRLLNIWARQLGHLDGLYTETGVGLETDVIASFLQYGYDLQESNGSAPASVSIEHQGGGIEQTMIGTSSAMMAVIPINQITALKTGTGSEFALLQLPVHEAGQSGQTFRSMSWAITSATEHPAEAAQLLDCLQGNLDAAEVLQAERGLPANQNVVQHIRDDLSPEQQQMADFVAAVEASAPDTAPMPPPPGADTAEPMLRRYAEDMLFGQTSPDEAAEQFANELDESIAAAN